MGAIAEETLARWAATVAFICCATALMWLLGASFSPWLGFLAGTVVFGAVAGPLWVKHLENVANARTRADAKSGSTRRLLLPEDEE